MLKCSHLWYVVKRFLPPVLNSDHFVSRYILEEGRAKANALNARKGEARLRNDIFERFYVTVLRYHVEIRRSPDREDRVVPIHRWYLKTNLHELKHRTSTNEDTLGSHRYNSHNDTSNTSKGSARACCIFNKLQKTQVFRRGQLPSDTTRQWN
jgi:hypothetical protein